MQALLVVDFFQKLLDQSPGFLQVAVFGAIDFLVFESLHETFRAGIVVGRCQSAHADTNAVLFELCGVVSRGILHATVRMMDKPRPWVASHQGHTQRFQDKSGFQTALQGPSPGSVWKMHPAQPPSTQTPVASGCRGYRQPRADRCWS